MHPVGQTWVSNHPDLLEGGSVSVAQCRACHGANDRGTVLSRAQTTRTVTSDFGSRTFWRGQQISCYDCHNGANSENASAQFATVVSNVATNTSNASAISMVLPGTDPNGNSLTFRVVSQPAHGSVGVAGNLATFFPEPGTVGAETFTFAAYDGFVESNLGTGTVAVVQGPSSIGVTALVPPSYPAGWPAAFGAVPNVTNSAASATFDWNFGDGTHSTNQFASHAYTAAGSYSWTVTASLPGASPAVANGSIQIAGPIQLNTSTSSSLLNFTWPAGTADAVLERTFSLLPPVTWETAPMISSGPNSASVDVRAEGNAFFRLRQVQ